MPRSILIYLCFLLTPAWLLANAAPPWRSGSLAYEPKGVSDIAIEREKLAFDLKPLAHGKPVIIEASYALNHAGSSRSVELVFITGTNEVTSAQCWLDDQPLKSVIEAAGEMPVDWLGPKVTPSLTANASFELPFYPREKSTTKWIRFTVPFHTGKQTLKVRYEVVATAYVRYTEHARFWQVAYVLSPAKAWKSFGGLDLSIQVPPGWRLSTSLPTTRSGDSANASFDNLPADTLALTSQFPMTPDRVKSDLVEHVIAMVVLLAVVLFCTFASWQSGQRLALKQQSSWRGLPGTLARSILLTAVIIAYLMMFVFAQMFQTIDLPDSQRNWLDGRALSTPMLLLLNPLCGMVLLGSVVILHGLLWRSRSLHSRS